MAEVGQQFALETGRWSVWEVVGVTKTPDGHRHAQLMSVDPPGDRKAIAATELERGLR